ncbi:MAG: 4-phosphoerythronate dehydrogenase [Gammaproteobacteria bacterium]|nr:MAG: 4-phosphoerythronate dehydrogenase [Gammaproteobacteria bacterium]
MHGVKIVADQNIPCVSEAFADLGEVELLPGRDIRPSDLQDCRCLLVRTVTRVDEQLLEGTAVEFVGTATIGTDHIDLDYLQKTGIGCSNAAGCNAEAASEYVVSGLFALAERRGFDPFKRRAGIVGYGNVGSRLVHKLETLGLDCLVNDPPLQAGGDTRRDWVDLDTILRECDFISLHVPLTRSGMHATFHLLDEIRLRQLGDGCLLVNAARGEVVNNSALLSLLEQRDDLHVFLDTWEGEPLPSRELLRRVGLATPHIAGYSVEGRLRGTQVILDAACTRFDLESGWHMSNELPPERMIGGAATDSWAALFRQHCNIWRDHEALLDGAGLDGQDFAAHFDSLRRVYPDRLEYERFRVDAATDLPATALQELGFQIPRP